MAVYLIGKGNKPHKAHYTSVLTEPSSYDAHTPPTDVQLGAVYYAQGERRVGTGKAFEYAEYGSRLVKAITDSEGNVYYGITFDYDEQTNLVFIAPSVTGDVVLQQTYLLSMSKGEILKIGKSQTGGDLNIKCENNRLIVYIADFSKKRTILRYFVGKDNHI